MAIGWVVIAAVIIKCPSGLLHVCMHACAALFEVPERELIPSVHFVIVLYLFHHLTFPPAGACPRSHRNTVRYKAQCYCLAEVLDGRPQLSGMPRYWEHLSAMYLDMTYAWESYVWNNLWWSLPAGAIRFGSVLEKHECVKILKALSKCRLPFQCAHGRPSVTPIVDLRFLPSEEKVSIYLLTNLSIHIAGFLKAMPYAVSCSKALLTNNSSAQLQTVLNKLKLLLPKQHKILTGSGSAFKSWRVYSCPLNSSCKVYMEIYFFSGKTNK